MKSLSISNNCDIQAYHTFAMHVKAKSLVHLKSKEDIQHFIQHKEQFPEPFLPLGSGSNMLFTSDFEGTLLRNELNYIETIYEDDDIERILVGGGVEWDDFVMHCVEQGLYGVENLRAIPGTVGAAPVQNIGAYGAEVKDVISQVIAYHLEDGEMLSFSNKECKFAYRNSIFKTELKNKVIIAEVIMELKKDAPLNTSYGSIEECLKSKGWDDPTPLDISECVKEIRDSKLPDPKEFGNAGSFFKNPVISYELLAKIQEKYPDIPTYKVNSKKVKVAAGWMIDALGWKGKSYGGAAVHEKQALVLINKENASPNDVQKLALSIILNIQEEFDITLIPEVNFI